MGAAESPLTSAESRNDSKMVTLLHGYEEVEDTDSDFWDESDDDTSVSQDDFDDENSGESKGSQDYIEPQSTDKPSADGIRKRYSVSRLAIGKRRYQACRTIAESPNEIKKQQTKLEPSDSRNCSNSCGAPSLREFASSAANDDGKMFLVRSRNRSSLWVPLDRQLHWGR